MGQVCLDVGVPRGKRLVYLHRNRRVVDYARIKGIVVLVVQSLAELRRRELPSGPGTRP